MARPRSSSWYAIAAAVIAQALAEAAAQGLDERATRAHVEAAYPFGPRKYWPYSQWLKARRDAYAGRAALAAWRDGAPIATDPGAPLTPLETYLATREGSS